MTYHHHITGAPAEARVAHLGRSTADNSPTPSATRRTLLAAALIAIGAFSVSTSAYAHPARDAGTSASGHAVVAQDGQPHATAGAITYTNPLRRSRGPGAGAGLL